MSERLLSEAGLAHLHGGDRRERVMMVGTTPSSEMLIRRMNMFPQYGFHVVGVLSDDMEPDTLFAETSVIGRVNDLPQVVKELEVDQVFLALRGDERDRLLHLIKTCEDEQLEFKIVPDLLEVMSTRVSSDSIDGLPVVGIRRSQLRGAGAKIKRAVDAVVSALLLILFSPVLLLITILIKVTMPGPVFFRQERIGYQRQPFVIYKFRSMIPDAEARSGPVVAKPGSARMNSSSRRNRTSFTVTASMALNTA